MNDIAQLQKERLALVAQIRSLWYQREVKRSSSRKIRDTAKLKKERCILSPQIRAAYKALDDFDLKQEKVREAMKKDNDREAQHSCR